ncbi:hypothetical protein PV396_36130 [Streptomyces sp. ME02-8801-2C]|uniref:hypothetical protein n=1 Tax=Streptomyces sp. ME02-8801-2C TaxID=3028680 RepID=UPI0029A55396|nr:hypothetical protein [Streptomyces sp. ME02-8801-2C]MDX3457326.1 hypothetical protein [Streptomyces sp. ME02-8801-2C]
MTETTTTSAPPTDSRPLDVVRGFLTSCVAGVSPTAFVVGCIIRDGQLIIGSLVLPVVYGLLNHLSRAPERARRAALVPVTALAMVESLKASGSELSSNVPIDFDLTVAPDDAPVFRARVIDRVNLVDVPDYQPRDIRVVEYPPDRPWEVRLVKQPTPEWQRRAADAVIDSAPESTLVKEPRESVSDGVAVAGLFGFLVGVAVVLLVFGADLFGGSDADAGKPSASSSAPSSPSPSSSSSSSSSSSMNTTVVSSVSGTVVLGSGQSFLDEGELRQAVESLTRSGKGQALVLAVEDSTLSVVFPPSGPQPPLFDPNSLPYERIPALVREARTALGVRSPQSWQLTADRLTGSLNLRVSVTGAGDDTASLVANGKGEVVGRTRGAN